MATRIDFRPTAPAIPSPIDKPGSAPQRPTDRFSPDGAGNVHAFVVPLAHQSRVGTLGFDTAAAPLIDPQQAVNFIANYNQQLGLSGPGLQAKNTNMSADALSLFTGIPALFYSDIKGAYAGQTQLFNTPAPTVTLDGDPHLGNFGTVRGPDGTCIYGLDDFDKSGHGPAEWDLDRMAVAVQLAARNANMTPAQQEQLVRDVASNYFSTLQQYGQTGVKPPGYLTASEVTGAAKALVDQQNAITQQSFIAGKTKTDSNGNLILKGKNLQPVDSATSSAITFAMQQYASGMSAGLIAQPVQIMDIKQKVNAGGSSFDMQRYEVLVAGANAGDPPRIIELKELLPSPVDDGTGDLSHANAANDVANEATLDGFANPFVSSTNMLGHSFLIRENSFSRANNSFDSSTSFADLDSLASQCAVALARSHAQSMSASDAAQWMSGDQATATNRLVSFASTYADQTDANWQAFKTATGN